MKKNKLTLLIYMAADNNLDKEALKDLESIRTSSVGSNINIVVQLDRDTLPNVREGFRYHFQNGEEHVEKLGEFNSGDPELLKTFIEEAMSKYSSEKVIVIVWSHGSGVDDKNPYADFIGTKKEREVKRSKLFELKSRPYEQELIGIAYDDTSKDFLDNLELKKALDTSKKIDVIGFDACLMGMFEIAYQLKNRAKVMVGSQYVEPPSGWDYSKIIKELKLEENSFIMGKQLVEFYANSDEHPTDDITQSAFNLEVVDDVARDLDAFSKVLLENVKDKKELKYKFLSSQLFGRSDYVDLIDFLENIEHSLKIESFEPYIKKLLNSLDIFILANYTRGHSMRGANGVSIYFPSKKSPNKETFEMYAKLDFSQEYPHWIELIRWYHTI